MYKVLFVILIIILVCILYFIIKFKKASYGGYDKNKHVVIDSLNLTHYLTDNKHKITISEINNTIDKTSIILRAKYPGQVMYVVKGQETKHIEKDDLLLFANTAKRNKVNIYVIERYTNEQHTQHMQHTQHTQHVQLGRDDYYMGLLANRYNCPVLSEDHFRDWNKLKASLSPFYVYEYRYYRDYPTREYIKPIVLNIPRPNHIKFSTIIS